LIIVLVIVVVAGGIIYSRINQSSEADNRVILFYRDSCPHCANVEEFVKANNIEEKYPFERLSVDNPVNAQLFMKKIKYCEIPSELAGVPLLWDRSKCRLGDADIINFFEEKIK